jgi:hypothetical protein
MKLSLAQPSSGDAGVTAVIPCYNYGHYLGQAVDSVLSQPDVSARVIIVDDASTDDSLAVARQLADADPRITVIAHEVNQGHIATYNDGLYAVETTYLTLLSADDLLAAGSLGRAAALMEAHPTVGMVYGQPVEFSGAPPSTPRSGRAPDTWIRWGGREWIRIACLRGRCFILSPEVVMRTEAVREIGGYNSGLPKSGDLEYWLRTASRWDVGRINGWVQAYYRQHETNMHVTTLPSMAADIRHRVLAFEYLLGTDFARAATNGPQLFRRACTALARESLMLAMRELDAGGNIGTAADLRAAAVDVMPPVDRTMRMRRLDSRFRRAAGGVPPSNAQHFLENLRSLADRVRWRIWVHTGVS